MSLILSSNAAPVAPSTPSAKTAARPDEQDQNNSGSFGEVLARSLKPAEEKTESPPVKKATAAPVRRQTDDQTTDAENLANTLALPFIPVEGRLAKAALPEGGVPAAGNAAQGNTTALLTNPDGTGKTAPTTTALLPNPDGAGRTALATTALLANSSTAASQTGTALLTSPDSTGTKPATALPNDLTPATPTGDSTATDAQSTLASLLSGAKPTGQTPLPAKAAAVNDGAALQVAPRATAGQTEAAIAGLSNQASKQDDKNPNNLGNANDAHADLSLVASASIGKTAASPATSALEAPALSTDSPLTTDTPLNAMQMTPLNAGVQPAGGVSASNAPSSIATASLTPEVGTNEWGKALGQHVVQMGTAGHQVAELQLNPPGLGPLKVTLSMNDQQMQAIFVSAHSSVRTAVEAALPQLRALLADSGISLGNTSVGAESQPQTAFSNGQNNQPERGGAYRETLMADNALLPARTLIEPTRRNSGLRIDTYA